MPSTSSGCVWIAPNASTQNRSSTPASMPEASDSGTRPSSRSNIPEKPASVISTADSRKPAIASAIGTPAALVTSIAAPGVDHAVTTGIFQRSDRTMQVAPMPRPSAHIHEAVWPGAAPIACAAWNTIAAELANPTSTVTKPAAIADTDWSRHRRTGRDSAGMRGLWGKGGGLVTGRMQHSFRLAPHNARLRVRAWQRDTLRNHRWTTWRPSRMRPSALSGLRVAGKTEGVRAGEGTRPSAQPLPGGGGVYRSRHRFGVLRGAHRGLGAQQLGDARGGVAAFGHGGHDQVGTAHRVAASEHARMGGLVRQAVVATGDDAAVGGALDAELRHPLRHGRREAEGDDHHVGLDHRLAALDRHRHAAATRIRLAQLRLDHAHAGDPVLLVGLDAQRLAVEQEAHAFLAGVGHLARRTGHGSLVAAVGTGDAAGAQADGAAHAVHAGVAAAQHHHTTAGQVGQLDVVFPAGDRTALRRGRIGAGDDPAV